MLTLTTCLEVDSLLLLCYKIALLRPPHPFLYCAFWKEITVYNPHFRNGAPPSPFFKGTRDNNFLLYVYTFIKIWIFCNCEQEVARKEVIISVEGWAPSLRTNVQMEMSSFSPVAVKGVKWSKTTGWEEAREVGGVCPRKHLTEQL